MEECFLEIHHLFQDQYPARRLILMQRLCILEAFVMLSGRAQSGQAVQWRFERRFWRKTKWTQISVQHNTYATVMCSAPSGSGGKESSTCRRRGFDPWLWKIPGEGKWRPIPIFLPGKSRECGSLVGYRSHGLKKQLSK